MTPPLQINLDKAVLAASSATRRLALVFEWGDCTVELYIPRGKDTQSVHDQDELYFIASGSGTLRREDELVEFAGGDMLFVPAGTQHCFDTFSQDFKAWAVFFGPPGGAYPLHPEAA